MSLNQIYDDSFAQNNNFTISSNRNIKCDGLRVKEFYTADGVIDSLVVNTINGIVPGSGAIVPAFPPPSVTNNDILMTKAGVAAWSKEVVLQSGLLQLDAASNMTISSATATFNGATVVFSQANTNVSGNINLSGNAELVLNGPAKMRVKDSAEISLDNANMSCTNSAISLNGGIGILVTGGANIAVGPQGNVTTEKLYLAHPSSSSSPLSMYYTTTLTFNLYIRRTIGTDIFIASTPVTFTRIGRSITMSTVHKIFPYSNVVIGITGWLKLVCDGTFPSILHPNPRWAVSTPVYKAGVQTFGVMFMDGDNVIYISAGSSVDDTFVFNNGSEYGYGIYANGLNIGEAGGVTISYTRNTDDF